MADTTFINQISDTLSKKPEYGIISSMLSVTMNVTDLLQFFGVVLGLFIAIITAILKVMELRDKIREKNGKEPRRRRRKVNSSEDE